MKLKEKVENIFRTFVESIINNDNNNYHGYLEGTLGIINSKIYMMGIHEEINLCNKYFKKNGNVLDFGTGAGLHSWILSFRNFQIDGIDIDNFGKIDGNTRATLNMARDQKVLWNKLSNYNSNLKFKHYSGNIPYKGNYFDGVIASAVLEHIPIKIRNKIIKEIYRVIKPGGYLLISRLPRKYSYTEALCRIFGLGHHQNLFLKSESIKMITEVGFIVEKFWFTDLFPSYPVSIANKLFKIFNFLEPILIKTPIKLISHDFRILAKKL